MAQRLKGLSVAILATDNFEQAELTSPKEALEQAGATVRILSARPGQIRGMKHDEKADSFPVDQSWNDAEPGDYAGVVIPGGVFNSDVIRMEEGARRFVQAIHDQGKPVAVICHGAWLLVSAGLVDGKQLTSWPSLQDDIRNAGGNWVDEEVVLDGNLITSRKPDDLPAFNEKLIAALATVEKSDTPSAAQAT
ncbi:MAG: type 1 glutamine amidotransferase domain-containing protein [Pigmentiphaga sp.]|uniref:type 1 glutamine amidotransferase domain-containing protein n=1 Tax=Pigmentiphaga sp. TaxID=1977564 RepID=UPI0029B1E328|nr:type 1 glutamine amidotransferase domain-containing protein [Pigmentiphaga sp.]MDX3907824.1 type 1 glutamine amidotransferase domain-containing protein [Pigmentiphaga sp.]